MSFLLRTARQPAFVRSIVGSTNTSRVVAGRRFKSDYGSGEANPETPNKAVDKEHPGPPPPSVAQKGNGQQQSSKSTQQQENSSSKDKSGAQPKILSANPPAEGEQPEDVAKHNREMESRHDKPHEEVKNKDAEKDKVHKGFWSGTGGVDKDP